MSSKIEVSRELLERAITAIKKHHSSTAWVIASELECVITDAPVVERQPNPPACVIEHGPFDDVGCPQWVRANTVGDFDLENIPDGTLLWMAPPELAELQATIAQQAAFIHWMKGLLWSGGRPRADEEEYEQMTDYDKGLLHGGIELWDQLDCRLRAKIKEIDLLSSGVASHG